MARARSRGRLHIGQCPVGRSMMSRCLRFATRSEERRVGKECGARCALSGWMRARCERGVSEGHVRGHTEGGWPCSHVALSFLLCRCHPFASGGVSLVVFFFKQKTAYEMAT